ncbi:PTS lactose/cellobiose transporter subunit IIA [Galactobacillus timonensis]|jgi:cellobiose-specific phosphotransferase system component IIA|uniref:PTS lactose/cellobiose transporter subunit IIA n=1 Tax=Galactobacillus timonensis TaxID=2041840 RepID=UPI000C85B65D|nr:PTS lactose/cellobiose transporter subunit IIA [Galactobacillus timonensis]
MTKEEVQMISFQVISHAGEAFDSFVKAGEAASNFDFAGAEELMKTGDQQLVQAHQSQTNLLNAEARNEEIPFSIILIHAQDHLMHAMSYEQNVRDLIRLYKHLAVND